MPFGPGIRAIALLRAFEIRSPDASQKFDRARDAGLEIVEGLVLVRADGRRRAGNARHAVAGLIAGDPHLLRERIHVRREPGVDQVEMGGLRVFGALVENLERLVNMEMKTSTDMACMEIFIWAPFLFRFDDL